MMISGFGEEFSAEKRRRGIIDYADAENLTLDLLTHDGNPTALAERIASDYDEIYIDSIRTSTRCRMRYFQRSRTAIASW